MLRKRRRAKNSACPRKPISTWAISSAACSNICAPIPVPSVTIAGGFGKLSKLAQGALDLHSARSSVEIAALAETLRALGAKSGLVEQAQAANTANEVLGLAIQAHLPLADAIADRARWVAMEAVRNRGIEMSILIVDRQRRIVGSAGLQEMKILILGGTGEARRLAEELVDLGHDVTTSLAGRTEEVEPHKGAVRSGGYGGIEGLTEYLLAEDIDYLIDATHPFAARMSANAVGAAETAGIPLLRLNRPAWKKPEKGGWTHAERAELAADLLPEGARVLLTTGHRDLEIFAARVDCIFVIRLIGKPAFDLPRHCTLITDRPPYDVPQEVALMREHSITHLVSKNSGGKQTAAKLTAAEALGVAVIMIDRPPLPEAPEVESVEDVVAALQEAVS